MLLTSIFFHHSVHIDQNNEIDPSLYEILLFYFWGLAKQFRQSYMPVEGNIYLDCLVIETLSSVDLQVSSGLAQRLSESLTIISLLL